MTIRRLMSTMLVTLAVATGADQAFAQEMGVLGWGFRAGFSIDPDQVFGGVHLDLGEPVKNLRLLPNIEFGVGDDTKLLAVGLSARWEFATVRWGGWMPYAGAELGFQYAKLDDSLRVPGRPFDDDDTDVQGSLLAGVQSELKGGNRLFIEAKIGLLEDPDLKALVGFTF